MDSMDTSIPREESGMPVVMIDDVVHAEAEHGMVYRMTCRWSGSLLTPHCRAL